MVPLPWFSFQVPVSGPSSEVPLPAPSSEVTLPDPSCQVPWGSGVFSSRPGAFNTKLGVLIVGMGHSVVNLRYLVVDLGHSVEDLRQIRYSKMHANVLRCDWWTHAV